MMLLLTVRFSLGFHDPKPAYPNSSCSFHFSPSLVVQGVTKFIPERPRSYSSLLVTVISCRAVGMRFDSSVKCVVIVIIIPLEDFFSFLFGPLYPYIFYFI